MSEQKEELVTFGGVDGFIQSETITKIDIQTNSNGDKITYTTDADGKTTMWIEGSPLPPGPICVPSCWPADPTYPNVESEVTMEMNGQKFKLKTETQVTEAGTSTSSSWVPIQDTLSPKKDSGLKDGGTRQTYGTGAMKEDSSKTAGKGAFHLLPFIPMLRSAEIWRKGAVKYAPRNWEKGIALSRFLDSGLRHGGQGGLAGKIDEDHIHQCLWNFMALSWTIDQINRGNLPATLNDLPSIGGPGDPNYRKAGPAIELKEEQKGRPEKEVWGRELSLEERYIPFMKDDIEYMKELGLFNE